MPGLLRELSQAQVEADKGGQSCPALQSLPALILLCMKAVRDDCRSACIRECCCLPGSHCCLSGSNMNK